MAFFVTLISVAGFVAAQTNDLDQEVDTNIEAWVATFKQLHAAPELSYQEKETSAFLADQLRQLGFDVTEGVGKYSTQERVGYGVVGVLRNGSGPTVMVRTDTDALPVVENSGLDYASQAVGLNDSGVEVGAMHACGHDLHMVSFLGTARMLSGMKDRWGGTLVMMSTQTPRLTLLLRPRVLRPWCSRTTPTPVIELSPIDGT